MFGKSFKIKIIIPAVVVLAALVIALNVFLLVNFSTQRDALIGEKLSANINSLKLYLDNSKANSRAAAVSMALNPDVVRAVRERGTGELLRIFTPTHSLYRINYYTICDSNGTVLARTHEPANFGDSVLGQQNIKDALAGKVSTYFEEGTVVKVSVRTGSPVYDTDGTLIGAVSAGIRFDTDSTINELKELFKSEVTVFFGDTRIVSTITRDGHSIAGTKLDPGIADVVIHNKQEYSGSAYILGTQYRTFYMPLLNARNEAFAAFFVGINDVEITAVTTRAIRNGILLGLGGLAVSILILFIIISSISDPIVRLSGDMERIANGNLNIEIKVKGEDEVGRLAGSFQKVAVTIHKLLEEINVMIGEHEKGNTDYCLNAGEFEGDYKSLALSVLKLTALSMKDQLTGVPNRRSFDNRLGWEWKRAINDKTSIGILIVNLDKFKNYNETFGRRQGDTALRTVVKTINQTLRPSEDFIARRESDEFFILLPATDSDGAVRVAETIRREVEKALIPSTELEGVKVTVSIGVNTQVPVPGKLVDNFISSADSALDKAKETGNSVVFYRDGNVS